METWSQKGVMGSADIDHFFHGLPWTTKWISFKTTFSCNFLGIHMLTLYPRFFSMVPKQFSIYIISLIQNMHAVCVEVPLCVWGSSAF